MSDTESFELNTLLFEFTFKISQVGPDGTGTFGTTFVVAIPNEHDPTTGSLVLVTAKHVLDGMPGRFATWHLRKKDESGAWTANPVRLEIRDAVGNPLWTSHPTADVAVMPAKVPQADGMSAFGTDKAALHTGLFVTDEELELYEVHPGDELNCLGYPLGRESNAAGFPVLRSGKIASYPISPTTLYQTFLFDFEVFPGNSGGPVYMSQANRHYGQTTIIGTIQFLAGLVSAQHIDGAERLALSVVVPSTYILETIALLPPIKNT